MRDEEVMHAMNLDDAYRVERVLASGAGGVTELVTLGGAGPFARKKVPLALANQNVWAAIASLDSARVPKVQATYSLPDLFVVIYDYVPGQTLQELVLASGRLDAPKAGKLATEICEAAEALHSRGVIHRDLSPRNVIVAADGAHLIDLGIARTYVDGAAADTTFLGTHGFAAPEQYGFAQTDARSDVYAIGCLLGFMLTGKEPDEEGYAEALTALEAAPNNGSPEDGNDAAANGDGAGTCAAQRAAETRLVACIRQACAFEPSARFQSAAQMSKAVAQALTAEMEGLPEAQDNSSVSRHGRAIRETGGGEFSPGNGEADALERTEAEAKTANDPTHDDSNKTEDGSAQAAPSDSASSVRQPNGTGKPTPGKVSAGPSKRVVVALAIALGLALLAIGGLLLTKGASTQETTSASSTTQGTEGNPTNANGTGADSDQSASAATVDELPLEIAESGWSITSGGYVNYVAGLRNTSKNTVVDLPIIKVVGYSSAGRSSSPATSEQWSAHRARPAISPTRPTSIAPATWTMLSSRFRPTRRLAPEALATL